MGQFLQWVGAQVQGTGTVQIWPGTPVSEALVEDHKVLGVRLLDQGVIRECVAWCHDITWTSPNSRSKVYPGYPWDLLSTYRSDITYVTISRNRQQELANLFGCSPEQIRIIYNGVDLERFGPQHRNQVLRAGLGLPDDALLCIFAGRLVGWKGVAFSLSALASERLHGLQLFFVVIGSGPEEKKLKALADSLGLADRVFFRASMPHAELPAWWASADIGLFASVGDEGFSNSIHNREVQLIQCLSHPSRLCRGGFFSCPHNYKVRFCRMKAFQV